MKFRIILLIAVFSLSSTQIYAQGFGTRMKDKLVNKMQNKAEQKIDKAMDSAIDKPVDKTEKKVKESVKKDKKNSGQQPPSNGAGYDEEQMNQLMNMMGGNASIEDYPDLDNIQPSKFKGSFDMIVASYDKNGKPKKDGAGDIKWFIRDYEVAMLPLLEVEGEQQEARMIINRKKGTMTVLTESNGSKTGMIMEMNTISSSLDNSDWEEEVSDMQVDIQRNVRRTVNGYPCYKVKVWDDEFESESWVTESIPLSIQDLFGFMSMQGKDNPYEEKFGHLKGMAVQTKSTNKKTGEVDTMDLKNVKAGNPDPSMFSTDGYQLMALPSGMGNFGQ